MRGIANTLTVGMKESRERQTRTIITGRRIGEKKERKVTDGRQSHSLSHARVSLPFPSSRRATRRGSLFYSIGAFPGS
jgi:hypothetical protein